MDALTSADRRALRARAHPLQPVVIIGESGLTPEVLREIDSSLKSHELIKVRVAGDDRQTRTVLVSEICVATEAHLVQQIGKIVVLFRPRLDDERKPAPARKGKRKPRRRTKRSYQRA